MKNSQRNPNSRRRGYILIVILGFAAVVTSLGLAFLDTHSTVMPEAVNSYGVVRAQYLAESGVALADHFLMYPPTTVSPCGFWTGANNIAVDASSDYTDVTVAQHPSGFHVFTVTAVGVALNPDGTIRGKRTVTATVIRPPGKKVRIPYALLGDAQLAGGGFGIPSTVQIVGDVHAENGDLSSTGWCQGKVSATDTVCWSACGGTGPPLSEVSSAASFSLPSFAPGDYASYTLDGTTYAALSVADSDWYFWEAEYFSSVLDVSMVTNPGRVIYRSGNLKLRTNCVINGTLAVTGSLTISGTGIRVTAVQGFPALVVTSNLAYGTDGGNVSFIGPVLVGNLITDSAKNNVVLNVTGACVAPHGFLLTKTNGTFVFTWDCNRSSFWNFNNPFTGEAPITILSWKEN